MALIFFQSRFLLRAKTQTTLVMQQCNLWKSDFTMLYFTLYLWHKEETKVNTYSINSLLSFRRQQEAINKTPVVAAMYWEDELFIFLKINSFILKPNLILILFFFCFTFHAIYVLWQGMHFGGWQRHCATQTDVPLTWNVRLGTRKEYPFKKHKTADPLNQT